MSFDRFLAEKRGFDAMISALGEGIHILSPDFRIVSQNETLLSQFGSAVGDICHNHVCRQTCPGPDCPARATFADGGIHRQEKLLMSTSGPVYVEIIASPVMDEQGGVAMVLEFFKDISHSKKVEETLKRQQLELEKQLHFEGALNRLAATIAANDDIIVILESMTTIIGETLEIDRCLIYEIDGVKEQAIGHYGWLNPDCPGVAPVLGVIDLKGFPGMEQMFLNQSWWESHEDQINPILYKEKSHHLFHQKLGIKSLLWFPFAFSAAKCYLLAINQSRYRRVWTEEEIEFLGSTSRLVEVAVQKILLLAEQRQAEKAMWEEKERAQITLRSIGDGVIATNSLGRVEYLNQAAQQFTGWQSAEARGRSIFEVFNLMEDDGKQDFPLSEQDYTEDGRELVPVESKLLICRDGRKYAVETTSTPLNNAEGNTIGVVHVFRDVTEKRAMIKQLMYQAYHDYLTNLPNRLLLNDRLKSALAHARRKNELVAVMDLDLDRFKLVNDLYGHAMGDELLKAVARRLEQSLRGTDTVVRLGGDEFALLMTGINSLEGVATVAQKLLDNMQQPLLIGDHQFIITTSIGVAVFPFDASDGTDLMKMADLAMYLAKETGRNNYRFSSPETNQKMQRRLDIENDLRSALQKGEILLYYQPLVTVNTGDLTAVEALIRWQHPQRGLIAPNEFIPIAEESGLIIPIGEWVLEEACRQNKHWQQEGHEPITVNVNISVCQFQRRDFLSTVEKVLRDTGLDPCYLELEITETIAMQDVEYTVNILDKLSQMGIKIAIDDFGTGYSSLSYLKRFPINTLKVDRSFVRDISGDSDDAAIVSAIIVLARNLNLKVVAEGVETEDQLDFLRKHRCGVAQGYLFSTPIPSREFRELMIRFSESGGARKLDNLG